MLTASMLTCANVNRSAKSTGRSEEANANRWAAVPPYVRYFKELLETFDVTFVLEVGLVAAAVEGLQRLCVHFSVCLTICPTELLICG